MKPDILILALVTAFVLYRLYMVLGSRTGTEKKRSWGLDPSSDTDEKVVHLKSRRTQTASSLEERSDALDVPFEVTETGVKGGQKVLDKIKQKDPDFVVSDFLTGAGQAFGMIMEAYATGNASVLRGLLSQDVYDVFMAAHQARQANGETLEIHLSDIHAEIVDARLVGKEARIQVRFSSEQRHVLTSEKGVDTEVFVCTDLWTFSRTLHSKNPNWILCDTVEEVAAESEE